MSEKWSRERYLAETNQPTQPTLTGVSVADHSNLGAGFEAEIAHVNGIYLNKKLVDVVRNPNAWEFVTGRDYFHYKSLYEKGDRRAARTGDGRYLRRCYSDVDFSGSSRGFIFDTKETRGKSFPLANVEEHQVLRLVRSAECGNVAGALIKFTELDRVFFAPAAFLEEKYTAWKRSAAANRQAARGTASISIAELEAHGIEVFRDKAGNWDWLKVLGEEHK